MANEDLGYEELVEFFNDKAEKDNERRKRKDWITKLPVILSLVVWSFLITVWMLLEQASPEVEWAFLAGFGRVVFGMEPVLRLHWNRTLVYIAYIFLLVSMGTCAIAVIINKLRMRRKEDRYKKSVFIVGGISVVAFVAFIIRFGSLLF